MNTNSDKSKGSSQVSSLRGFSHLGRSVTQVFLSKDHLQHQFPTFCEKIEKAYIFTRSLKILPQAQSNSAFKNFIFRRLAL